MTRKELYKAAQERFPGYNIELIQEGQTEDYELYAGIGYTSGFATDPKTEQFYGFHASDWKEPHTLQAEATFRLLLFYAEQKALRE